MSENHKIKIKNNLQINFHNHISKPSYLITIDPDKFLQKSNFNSAMTIKERNEINPEMAEIVRKILLKRKKEKNKKYFNINNHSLRKDRKVKSLKKYFDENNKGIKKENILNINNNNSALILSQLNDKFSPNNKNIKYFDYINKSISNKIKIINKKKLDILDINLNNHSISKYNKKNIETEPNLKNFFYL